MAVAAPVSCDGRQTTPVDHTKASSPHRELDAAPTTAGDPLIVVLRTVRPLVGPKGWNRGYIEIGGYRFPASTTLCLQWAIDNLRSPEYLTVFAEQLNVRIFDRHAASEDDADAGVEILRREL